VRTSSTAPSRISEPSLPSYRVTFERGTDGTYLAWVDDLPGCAVRAESREKVLERLPDAIRSFLTWAGTDASGEIDVEVVEEVDSAIEADEDTEVLVAVDRQALTSAYWEEVQRLLDRSRAELLELLETVTDDDLAARREGSERTIREEIEHVAFVELMYAMWTFDLQSKDGLGEFLAWTRNAVQGRMHALVGNDAVTSADWAGAPGPEPWTARKAARRLLWHELLHLRALESR
jgi:predicted RNase H-like HicB family nuclease